MQGDPAPFQTRLADEVVWIRTARRLGFWHGNWSGLLWTKWRHSIGVKHFHHQQQANAMKELPTFQRTWASFLAGAVTCFWQLHLLYILSSERKQAQSGHQSNSHCHPRVLRVLKVLKAVRVLNVFRVLRFLKLIRQTAHLRRLRKVLRVLCVFRILKVIKALRVPNVFQIANSS